MSAKEKENESYVWWMCGETISMLKIRKEIECYDKVMELYPNYFTIWFILGLGFKLKAKEYFQRSKLFNKTKREIKWKNVITHLFLNTIYYLRLSIIENKLSIIE